MHTFYYSIVLISPAFGFFFFFFDDISLSEEIKEMAFQNIPLSYICDSL